MMDGRAHAIAACQLLKVGRFPEGWEAYEARLALPEFQSLAPFNAFERWRGEPAASVLIAMEQGIGDKVQMLRYLPIISRQVGRLYVADADGLAQLAPALIGTSDDIVWIGGQSQIPASTVWAPSMSVPALFQDLWWGPYLRAIDQPVPGRVGLCCFGNPRNSLDQRRSLPIPAAGQLRQALQAAGFEVVPLHGPENDGRWQAAGGPPVSRSPAAPWPSLLAQIATCEAVVTVDTAAVHLAGAMGKRTHLLTYEPCDWRWMIGDVSPWYPSVQIHRQTEAGAWDAPLNTAIQKIQNKETTP